MRSICPLFLVVVVGCDGRSLPVVDGDAAVRDAGADGDLASFCSGSAKVSINGAALKLESVAGEEYISAAHAEGARVKFIASSASGDRWEINAQVMLGLKKTLTDKPLPRTAAIGPPAGLEGDAFFRKPPDCTSKPPCFSDLLTSDHHKFQGHATLAGKDYRSPLQLLLCMSASDAGWPAASKHEVHTVKIFSPAVTIPRWRLQWAP